MDSGLIVKIALMGGHVDIAEKKLNVMTSDVLAVIVYYGYLDKFKYLMPKNIDVTDALITGIDNIEYVKYLTKFNYSIKKFLAKACIDNNKVVINLILDEYEIENCKLYLDIACRYSDLDIVKKLCKLADPDKHSVKEASKRNNADVIKFLVNSGLSITSSFNYAVEYGGIDVIKVYLTQKDLRDDDMSLEMAIKRKDQKILKLLLDDGRFKQRNCDIYQAMKIGYGLASMFNVRKYILLIMAIKCENVSAVRELLKCDISAEADGNAALRLACRLGHDKIVELLLLKRKVIELL